MTSVIDVLCVGDLDVDLLVAVPALPGFDEKVSGRRVGLLPGGMSANTAVALARLGRSVRLLAAVGDDAEGEYALASVVAEGVDTTHVVRRERTGTFMCIVLLTPSGEKSLVRLETDAYLPRIEEVSEAVLHGVRHVHVTYGDAALAAHVLHMARDRGLSRSLDLEAPDIARAPKALAEVLPLVDTLFVNRAAFEAAGAALGAALRPHPGHGPGRIVVTLGAEGSRLIAAEGTVEMPGVEVTPVDTTGAGDCFAAAFLTKMLEAGEPADALRFANMAAALSTLAFGARGAMPFRADVDAHLDGERQAGKAAYVRQLTT